MIREGVKKKVYHCTSKESADKIIREGFNTPDVYFCPHPLLYSEYSAEGGEAVIQYEISWDDKLYNDESDYVLENYDKVVSTIDKIVLDTYEGDPANEKVEIVLVGHRINLENLKLLDPKEIKKIVKLIRKK